MSPLLRRGEGRGRERIQLTRRHQPVSASNVYVISTRNHFRELMATYAYNRPKAVIVIVNRFFGKTENTEETVAPVYEHWLAIVPTPVK